jgi:transcriptional regulator with XRE-family HTH domain
MKTVNIDGARLRVVLHNAAIRQRALAQQIGVSHYNVSRWCRKGEHAILKTNAERIAQVLGVTYPAFLEQCASRKTSGDGVYLSAAEADWLGVYRSLNPLEQARLRVALEDILRRDRAKPTR